MTYSDFTTICDDEAFKSVEMSGKKEAFAKKRRFTWRNMDWNGALDKQVNNVIPVIFHI